ncbi:AAEL004265-PA [Aedes aegypti]|uniref:AAEL004265-PA n=1 Tax=Aedes aegypti TaxID=7159 RepID=Q17DD7_AEDAE|nr:AAEL004265-PA [Aedes aegypti]
MEGEGVSGAAQTAVRREAVGAAPIVRAGMFGQIEQYVVGENFGEYVNRLEMFFLVNDTPDDKKVPVLVTGPSLYSIAARLSSPEDPRTRIWLISSKSTSTQLRISSRKGTNSVDLSKCRHRVLPSLL